MAASNSPSLDKISIVDTAEEILDNADLFKSGGVLYGLSPDSVTAENVTEMTSIKLLPPKPPAAMILLENPTGRTGD